MMWPSQTSVGQPSVQAIEMNAIVLRPMLEMCKEQGFEKSPTIDDIAAEVQFD
jgi:hypothetical protein